MAVAAVRTTCQSGVQRTAVLTDTPVGGNMKRILFALGAALILQGFLSAQAAEPKPTWLFESVSIRDARWHDLLSVSQRIGGFTVRIEAEDEALLQPLTIVFDNARIDDILKLTLGSVGLSFKVVDEKTVQVFKPTAP
jgi:hypothetical protein